MIFFYKKQLSLNVFKSLGHYCIYSPDFQFSIKISKERNNSLKNKTKVTNHNN